MLLQIKRTAGIVLLTAAAALSAGASPNGLTQIPIAKVFTDGVADFSVERDVLNEQTTTFTTQYGLFDSFELGLDNQSAPSDQRSQLGNLKYLIAHKPGKLPDIAFGIQDISSGKRAIPYLVATTQPKATGFSLGVIRADEGPAYLGMAGLSYNVTPEIQLVTDYIGGSESYSTYGIIAELTKTIALNVAYARPNTAGNAESGFNRRGFIVNIGYTFHTKPDAKALAEDKKDEKQDEKKNEDKGGKGEPKGDNAASGKKEP